MRPTASIVLAACCVLLAQASAEPVIDGELNYQDVVTVRRVGKSESKQALPIFLGISRQDRRCQGPLFVEGRHSSRPVGRTAHP